MEPKARVLVRLPDRFERLTRMSVHNAKVAQFDVGTNKMKKTSHIPQLRSTSQFFPARATHEQLSEEFVLDSYF